MSRCTALTTLGTKGYIVVVCTALTTSVDYFIMHGPNSPKFARSLNFGVIKTHVANPVQPS